jgi:hypothetical protein
LLQLARHRPRPGMSQPAPGGHGHISRLGLGCAKYPLMILDTSVCFATSGGRADV